MDSVFGHDSGWRQEWNALPNHEAATIRRGFAEFYRKQLQEQAGYSVFGEKTIQGPNGPLYRLMFASKHAKGLEFWEKVNLKDFHGQQSLF